MSRGREVAGIEVVADRTAGSRPDEGFLRLRRLQVRNRYADGSCSEPYACDVVSRLHVDAVAVVIYEWDGDGAVRVALRTGVRPPVTLRREKRLSHDQGGERLVLAEVVAGMLEPEDAGPGGVERRAAAECAEEAGQHVAPGCVERLGAPLFASPGITDELVHYRAVRADLDERGAPSGDGSVMEEAGEVIVLELAEAIRRCRDGRIADAKTEVALLRLSDALGYDHRGRD